MGYNLSFTDILRYEYLTRNISAASEFGGVGAAVQAAGLSNQLTGALTWHALVTKAPQGVILECRAGRKSRAPVEVSQKHRRKKTTTKNSI